MSGDTWPSQTTVKLFKKMAPEAKWRVITHGPGAPRWGSTDAERTQPNGMVVGYLEMVRRIQNRRVSSEDYPICCNARDCVGTNPFQHRTLAALNVFRAYFDGFCWKGLDYWTYTTPQGTHRSALNSYVRYGNCVGGTPRTLAAPGPHGAVATVQYEMLREGIQDCEAMLLIRRALADQKLRARIGDARAKRCDAAIEDLLDMLETGYRIGCAADYRSAVARLYAAAAEISRAVPPRR